MINVQIGRFCSIAPAVEVIYGTHPENNFLSTHPAFYSLRKQAGFTFVNEQKFTEFKHTQSDQSVFIGNDVWIGYGASILEGVTIGDGAIIGARASVARDVEPYSINVGVPARKVGYRFKPEEINALRQLEWWNEEFDWIKRNAAYFEDISKIGELQALACQIHHI